MPYVKQERREGIFLGIAGQRMINISKIECPGDLNYAITERCKSWLEQHGTTYTAINDVIGVLECAKLEFYRRVAAPYEDKKIDENGDVY